MLVFYACNSILKDFHPEMPLSSKVFSKWFCCFLYTVTKSTVQISCVTERQEFYFLESIIPEDLLFFYLSPEDLILFSEMQNSL